MFFHQQELMIVKVKQEEVEKHAKNAWKFFNHQGNHQPHNLKSPKRKQEYCTCLCES
ncbi:hypothetical protein ACFSCX_25280 [Bacillus salitolerans]|uniref:Uncharacterized protein n=1 Tax=Bacillus salitolerans TaxID=1437434 RepID=A0ABW4LZA5_9BACI